MVESKYQKECEATCLLIRTVHEIANKSNFMVYMVLQKGKPALSMPWRQVRGVEV
jgi:hypothetical protein